MALILSIETSTAICSIAVHSKGELLSLAELNESGAHAEKIMGLIEVALEKAGIQMKDLDAIAVSEGPGSYTGLRIGVSTAKGLAFGLDKPLIGINTLQAMATAIGSTPAKYIIPVLDARRMEVYYQVFDQQHQPVSKLDFEILEENSFENYLTKGKVVFLGDAVDKIRQVIAVPQLEIRDGINFSALHMGELAFGKFKNKEFEDIAYFVPNYLKEFKALHSKKNPLLSL
ncbi:tRNA (adenosine(37)-N6)-threonylcarbamoyltransferase complex dimerization subunit type 1 TsaB [Algoriphagus mannitolivorans]|uniref:tRNA (adenosine(37)-N6)-threonylcarbamoyltransferase complex dimerization subunit type 1 TsaB n=1 Tax=Algoriphagus mannitolivorans TaxID=226504 RepID=UPI0004008B2B|nr:tRNA (adenosine(37)-N6)-threonylcarbamoyltransferase complex dimerization subunit type 1 TsaB [Algoriphagus mannitolivorans]